ncbi:MAG: tRNA (guanosine(46)-N7)-methyltransferase TrmB [Thioalkalivibrionaceae bacterium]
MAKSGALAQGEAEGKRHRRIRSFVKREGRLTPGQSRALAALGERYLLTPDATPIRWSDAFATARCSEKHDSAGRAPDFAPAAGLNAGDVVLEIGFGDGASLARQAARDPQRHFLGVEVHRPGVGHLLIEAERLELDNLRVVEQDAVEVIARLAPASLGGVQVLFPDPWHKKRHHKRRLIQPEFLIRLAAVVRAGGYLHLATDWADYAEHMQQALAEVATLWRPEGGQPLASRPLWRAETKFERRGLRLGHEVADFVYRRRTDGDSASSA